MHEFEQANPCASFFFQWKTSAVSTTDCMVETQLCKPRDTSDALVGRAYSMFHLQYVWCLWTKPTIWLLIQFNKFDGRPFARVLDIARWLPWMLPGSTGRFPQPFCVLILFTSRYITRIEGGLKYAWSCYMVNCRVIIVDVSLHNH